MTPIRQRRMLIGLIVIVSMMGVLLGRLMWIQVIDADSFSSRNVDLVAHSVAQREVGIQLDSGRGHFYDRNGLPITGETVRALVVFPLKRAEGEYEARFRRLARILNVGEAEWNAFYRALRHPQIWTDSRTGQPVPLTERQAEDIASLSLPSVAVMPVVRRYPEHAAAKHLIGFIGEHPERIETEFASQLQSGTLSLQSRIGSAGLEKTLETYLQGVGDTAISLFTDGANRPLPGLGVRLVSPNNPYYPLRVDTTIDLPIQTKIERLIDKVGIREGAVVVLDARNADVVAMASRPDFDPYDVRIDAGSWSNKALKASVPGSIFKTVVAAAALEEKAVRRDETFECNGSLGKYGFTCWLKEGHGKLTLEEAFAVSCNVTFAKVMQRLGGGTLQQYARKLGLDREVGWTGTQAGRSERVWKQFDGEERGQIFAGRTPVEDEGVRVQTAIGQRDVLVTPLQAANLVVTLLNGGEARSPRVVKDIRFRNGSLVRSFPEQELIARGEGVSARTADVLAHWMEDVVEYGTGKALRQAKWKLAGKSGTAEVAHEGRPAVNQWFVGYGPADRPKYAVAAVALNEPENGANKAIAAFRGIMDILAGS